MKEASTRPGRPEHVSRPSGRCPERGKVKMQREGIPQARREQAKEAGGRKKAEVVLAGWLAFSKGEARKAGAGAWGWEVCCPHIHTQ